MKFTEKPKTIEAVQFNSHENIGEVMRLCKPRAIRYEENPSGRTLMIWLNHGETSNDVKPGEYVMLDPEAAQKRLVIVPGDEFDAKYQYQSATNPFGVQVNDNGTITGFGIGVPHITTIRGIAGDPE